MGKTFNRRILVVAIVALLMVAALAVYAIADVACTTEIYADPVKYTTAGDNVALTVSYRNNNVNGECGQIVLTYDPAKFTYVNTVWEDTECETSESATAGTVSLAWAGGTQITNASATGDIFTANFTALTDGSNKINFEVKAFGNTEGLTSHKYSLAGGNATVYNSSSINTGNYTSVKEAIEAALVVAQTENATVQLDDAWTLDADIVIGAAGAATTSPNTITITGSSIDTAGFAAVIYGNYIFKDIELNGSNAYNTKNCLCFPEGNVTFLSGITVANTSKRLNVVGSNLTVSNGYYRDIAANIHGSTVSYDACVINVNGDTNVDYLLAGSMNGANKAGVMGAINGSTLTVTGNVTVNTYLLGGGWYSAASKGCTTTIDSEFTGTVNCTTYVAGIIGGTHTGEYTLNIEAGTFAKGFYAAKSNTTDGSKFIATSNLNISGGSYSSAFFCGALMDKMSIYAGTANVNISGGTFTNNFYGGGQCTIADYEYQGTQNVNITGGTIGSFNAGSYFGGQGNIVYGGATTITIGSGATVGSNKLNCGSLFITTTALTTPIVDKSDVTVTLPSGMTVASQTNLWGRWETAHANNKYTGAFTVSGNHTLNATGVTFTGNIYGLYGETELKYTLDLTGTATWNLTDCTISATQVAFGGFSAAYKTTSAATNGKNIVNLTNVQYTKGASGQFFIGTISKGYKLGYVTNTEATITDCTINSQWFGFGSYFSSTYCDHKGNTKATVTNTQFTYANKAYYMGSVMSKNACDHSGDLDLTFDNCYFGTSWSFGYFGGSYFIKSTSAITYNHTGDIKSTLKDCTIGSDAAAGAKTCSKYVYGGTYADTGSASGCVYNRSGNDELTVIGSTHTNTIWGGDQVSIADGVTYNFNANTAVTIGDGTTATTVKIVYGGLRQAAATGTFNLNTTGNVTLNKGTYNGNISGGANIAVAGTYTQNGNVTINKNCKFVAGNRIVAGIDSNLSAVSYVTGDTSLTVQGTVSVKVDLIGGHRGSIIVTGDSTLNINDGADIYGAVNCVYGGSYLFTQAFVTGEDVTTPDGSFAYNQIGDTICNITGGTANHMVQVAGARCLIDGNIDINISGGTVGSSGLYGLTNQGSAALSANWYNYLSGNVDIDISGGTIKGNIYGGGMHTIPDTGDTSYIPKNGCNKICGYAKMTISGGTFLSGNLITSGCSGAVGGCTVKFVGADYNLSALYDSNYYVWNCSIGGAGQSAPGATGPMILDLSEVTLNDADEVTQYENNFCCNPHAAYDKANQWWMGAGTTQGYKTVYPAMADMATLTFDPSTLEGQELTAGSKLDLSALKLSATFTHTVVYNGKDAEGTYKIWNECNSVSNIAADKYTDAITFISQSGNELVDGKVGYNTTAVKLHYNGEIADSDYINVVVTNSNDAVSAILNNFGYVGMSINPYKSGLRVRAKLSAAALGYTKAENGYTATKYGMIVSTDNSAELTIDSGKTVIYAYGGSGDPVFKDEADGTRTFAAVVTGIKAANYSTNIYFRPFLEFVDANGDAKVVYATQAGIGETLVDIATTSAYDVTSMSYGPSLYEACQKFYTEWNNAEEAAKASTYYGSVAIGKTFIDTVLA